MSLRETISAIKLQLVNLLADLTEKIATKFFNYPSVMGMPVIGIYNEENQQMVDFVRNLPVHISAGIPPVRDPKTWGEVIFGTLPFLSGIERTYYYKKDEGYFNFYFQNFKNIFFLPDFVSKWLQLHFNITTDIRYLVAIQEIIFITIVLYYMIIEFRVRLFWFLTINPYARPLVYMIGMTDWLLDGVAGFIPSVGAVDYSTSILLYFIGKIADSLNHLVFTMPFLPSEFSFGKMRMGKKMVDVVVYSYLPFLWTKYPIPDSMREFWYTERPEIYKYMKKYYGQLGIQLKPDRIFKTVSEEQNNNFISLIHSNVDNVHHLSTNVISNISLNSNHYLGIFVSNSVHTCYDIFHKIIH